MSVPVSRETPGPAGGAALAAAVIGARGFVGSHLTRALRGSGAAVAAFTRDRPAVLAGGQAGGGRAGGGRAGGGRLAAPLRAARVIYYLATSINPMLAERHPELVSADLDAFRRFADAAAAAATAPVVVLASSGGTVYDTAAAPPYREDAPLAPGSAYGQAKLRLETDLLDRGGALTPVILRLSNVYGPGQRTGTGQGVIGHWVASLRAGQPLRILGDPAAERDYVYVGDVVEAMLAIGRHPAGRPLPTVLNIGSGVPTSLAELLASLQRAAGRTAQPQYAPGRGFDRRRVWLDVRQAGRTLGWQPRTALTDGLAKTWAAAVGQADPAA
jgi:nucleoside-diphosphate-sugar epimerase